jgi:hypothetical protein
MRWTPYTALFAFSREGRGVETHCLKIFHTSKRHEGLACLKKFHQRAMNYEEYIFNAFLKIFHTSKRHEGLACLKKFHQRAMNYEEYIFNAFLRPQMRSFSFVNLIFHF